MIINHNMNALNAHRNMTGNTAAAGKSMEKLSSGLRINKAGDDAAGLAISEKMRGQIRGLDQAGRNAQDGISMIQTAEGALNETHSILQRMRELAVQSSNDTNVSVDRTEIQKEMDELAKEVTRIANNTEFNTQKLINGGISDDGIKSAKFHVGANAGQNVTLSINAMDAKSLGVSRDITAKATGALASTANTAITSVSFAKTVGTGVVDDAEITFTYNAGQTATQSSLTGAGNIDTTQDLTTGGNTKMTISVGTTDYEVDLSSWDGSGTKAGLAALIAGATDTNGVRLDTVASVTQDGTKMTIELNDAGATDLTIAYSGTKATQAATATGIANNATDTGDAQIDAILSITDGTNTQHVNVGDGTAKTLTVSTGAFEGMTIGTGSDTLADIHADDKVTVTAETTKAKVAEFVGGALKNEAVTEAGIDVSTQSAASAAITTIQTAIETVSAERSKLGAYANRLEHTANNLGTASENLTSAESRVRDVDMAKEMMQFSKNNILSQAAQAMISQANQQPQGVLQLLR